MDEAIYELESPAQAGNLNSTPEYTLSMIEKAINNATDFATIFNLYIGGEPGGDHVEVIKGANELAQALSDVLINTKGVTRLVDEMLAGRFQPATPGGFRAPGPKPRRRHCQSQPDDAWFDPPRQAGQQPLDRAGDGEFQEGSGAPQKQAGTDRIVEPARPFAPTEQVA